MFKQHQHLPSQTRSIIPGDLKPVRRSGFVLVFVLVLILVAGLSIAGFARKSLELARTVADAQEDLQRRWGTRSCQRFALANSELLLDAGNAATLTEARFWPRSAVVDVDFDLGGFHYELRLSDEDAKINLNALASRGQSNPDVLISEIVQRTSVSSGLIPAIRTPAANPANPARAGLQTWEQVFDLGGVSDTNDLVSKLKMATAELTCWGSGKLNLQRTSDASIQAVCENLASATSISRLLAMRREGGFRSLDILLGRLDLKNNDQAVFRRLLALDSKCHAVWLTVRSSRRSWNSLTIDRSGKGNPTTFESFVW